MAVWRKRSTYSAPEPLSNSYLTGTPPKGISIKAWISLGGFRPAVTLLTSTVFSAYTVPAQYPFRWPGIQMGETAPRPGYLGGSANLLFRGAREAHCLSIHFVGGAGHGAERGLEDRHPDERYQHCRILQRGTGARGLPARIHLRFGFR